MPIKITFCMYQVITGGIENCLVRILEKMCTDKRYQFTIVTKKTVVEEKFINFFRKNNIKVITYDNLVEYGCKPRKKLHRFIWKTKKIYIKAKNHFLKQKYKNLLNSQDIVIDYFNGSFLYQLRHINNPKKIIFYHASINAFEKNMSCHCDTIFSTYNKFVCLTKSFYDDITAKYPQYKDKFLTIYNPIDITNIKHIASVTNCPEKTPFFLFVARFHEDKDHITLIDAFHKFYQHVKEGNLLLIGDGPTKDHVTNYINSIGMQNNIKLLGTLSNPYGYMKNSLANILSSPSEGLSTILIEGASVGALNVSSNCPSCASEILLDGKAGLLFPVGDSNTLANLMIKIWNKEIDRATLITNANNALNRFSTESVIPKLIELFDSCINS